ncbi:MAG TPA: site-2 protease family protein [Burkholderiales bacterium]|nr:site-2 protease family protein [Burkholderiales bacterium]
MNWGIGIGRIRGIDIRIDWSLAIVFVLITLSLGGGVFPRWHPEWGAALSWITAMFAAVLFFVSVLLHELAHALVGRRYGLPVRSITLFVFGGVADLEREPDAWRAELWMALVGPVASLAIGVLCMVAVNVFTTVAQVDPDNPIDTLARLGPLATILAWLGPVNILLGVFNLVPGFPLDGGRVLRAALWGFTGDIYRATRWATGLGRAVGWTLIAIGFAMIWGVRVPIFGTGPIGGMWLALIGWFLSNAALMSYQQMVARRRLEGVPVSQVMMSRFVSVGPDMALAQLIEEHLLRTDQRAFPVVENGRLVGLVCLDDVRKIDPIERDRRIVRDIMTPASSLVTIAPGQDAAEALQIISRREVNQLRVVENGCIEGLVRREDILKWLALRSGNERIPA